MRKRLLCMLLSILCMTVGVLATETYADIGVLYQHWSMTEWPSWVCSVSSTDGSGDHLTVVVESQAAAEKLAAMVEDDSTLTIIVSMGGYTDSQLRRVQEEIVAEYMKTPGESPVIGIGVGWTVIDGQVTGFGESGKESRVVVDVLTDYADEYRALFQKKYGDMVYVEASEGNFVTTGGLVHDVGLQEQLAVENRGVPVWYLWGLVVLLCGAAVVLRGHRVTAVQTADGRTGGAFRRLTAGQVETLVAEDTKTPDEQVYRNILKRVGESENL